jgi:hypothetical protein
MKIGAAPLDLASRHLTMQLGNGVCLPEWSGKPRNADDSYLSDSKKGSELWNKILRSAKN